LKTLISIMIYISVATAPVGILIAFVSLLYGKFTGRPPTPMVDDTRANDLVFLIGMLLAVIGIALGFVGLTLALVFVTPTLSGLIKFVGSLFGLLGEKP
jgi:hypothetical protein